MLSGLWENRVRRKRADDVFDRYAPMVKREKRGGAAQKKAKVKAEPGKMKVGTYLKEMRGQSGLSLRQVVMMSAGMLDKTTVSRVEKNERVPSLRAAYAFSRIYRIRMENIAELALDRKLIPGPPPFAVSDSEKEMLEKIRRLPKPRRALIAEIIHCIDIHCDENQH